MCAHEAFAHLHVNMIEQHQTQNLRKALILSFFAEVYVGQVIF